MHLKRDDPRRRPIDHQQNKTLDIQPSTSRSKTYALAASVTLGLRTCNETLSHCHLLCSRFPRPHCTTVNSAVQNRSPDAVAMSLLYLYTVSAISFPSCFISSTPPTLFALHRLLPPHSPPALHTPLTFVLRILSASPPHTHSCLEDTCLPLPGHPTHLSSTLVNQTKHLHPRFPLLAP